MARTHTFNNSRKTVTALYNLDTVSRFLALQLVERGLVKIEVIHTESRGRPEHKYVLSGKGRGYLALARNWGKKLENLKQNFKAEVEAVALAA